MPHWHVRARALLCLTAGLLFTLGLAPFDYKLASLVSLTMLAISLNGQSWRQGALLGWLFGLGFFGAGVSWVYVSINVYGTPSVPLAVFLTAVFCGGLAVLLGLQSALFCAVQPKTGLSRVVCFASLWVVFEWLRTWLLTGFPWLFAGYATLDTPLEGWAPIVGVFGLSLFLALTAAGLAEVLIAPRARGALTLTAWITSVMASGIGLSHVQWTEMSGEAINVVVYQPNTSLQDKWDRRNRQRFLKAYLEHAETYSPQADLVVWPEGALPFYLDQAPAYVQRLRDIASENNTSIIAGVPTRAGNKRFNSMMSLGHAMDQYRKQKLVPFGEFVPLEAQLRGLIAFFDLPMSNFSPGSPEQHGLSTRAGTVAPFICYEIVYPDFVAAGSRNAPLLITISNDAWFGTSHGPHQHFQMVRFRALELQKPIIRGASTGITATIGIDGRVDTALSQFETANLRANVQPYSGLTPYARWGSSPVLFFSLVFSALVAIKAQRRRPLS